MGSCIRGFARRKDVRWRRTRIRGGRTIIGVALRTRESAVSETARVAARFDLPRDAVEVAEVVFSSGFWVELSVEDGAEDDGTG